MFTLLYIKYIILFIYLHYFFLFLSFLFFFFFLIELQPMASTPDKRSLLSNQDTN